MVDLVKKPQAEGQVSMDLTMPLVDGNYVYRCTRCGSSNVPIDSVSASVDPRWVLGRCLDCSYTILTRHPIPQQEEQE